MKSMRLASGLDVDSTIPRQLTYYERIKPKLGIYTKTPEGIIASSQVKSGLTHRRKLPKVKT